MSASRLRLLAAALLPAALCTFAYICTPHELAEVQAGAAPSPVAAPPTPEPAENHAFGAAGYPWLVKGMAGEQQVIALSDSFAPPAGYKRIPAATGSFASWLRGLPLRSDRRDVLAYDGRMLNRPSAAVVLMDVGDSDLMQCADSLIRLHAEFLWSQGRAEEAGYRFTSGDLSRWSDWVQGERFSVRGSRVERRSGRARGNDHQSFRRWLDLIFNYAGTASLARDAHKVGMDQPLQAGDFFVDPGFPGHAVMLLDLAEDPSRRRVALVGQGFMPAEEFHVLRSPDAIDTVWFPLPEEAGESLATPSWEAFSRSSARRFP